MENVCACKARRLRKNKRHIKAADGPVLAHVLGATRPGSGQQGCEVEQGEQGGKGEYEGRKGKERK